MLAQSESVEKMLRTSRISVLNLYKSKLIPADFQRPLVRLNHDAKEPKTFVIKIHSKSPKSLLLRQCEDKFKPSTDCPDTNFTRAKLIDALQRLSVRAQIESKEFLDKLQLGQHLEKFKDRQVLKFNEKVLPVIRERIAKENLMRISAVVKETEMFKQILLLPQKSPIVARNLFCRAHKHWIIFMESEMRVKLEKIAIRLYRATKKIVITIYHFIDDCYIKKSNKKF